MDLIGKTLGNYQLKEELGRGGMAVVYLAYQPSLDRNVALKVLPSYFQYDVGFLVRFQREARAAAQLSHPNIVAIYDTGEVDGLHYIAMEYLEGGSLAERLVGRPMDLAEAERIVQEVGSALDYAHGQGLVHRDIKPSNILFTAEGRAKISDFGIVRAAGGTRLTRTGVLVGTPEYMAPEQVQGEEVDRRADLYALGVVLYQMVTGSVPFRGTTPHAVMHAVIYEAPPPPREGNPGLSRAVEGVLLKALAKDPTQRFQRASEFARALQQTDRGKPVAATPPPLAAPPPSIVNLFRIGALIGIIVVALVVILLVRDQGSQVSPVESPASPVPQASPAVLPTLPVPSGSQSRAIPGILFAAQMVLFTAMICLAPTFTYHLTKRWGRWVRAVVETVLFALLLLVFGAWLLGADALGVWLAYAVALILVLEVGSHLVERYKVTTLERLSRSSGFKSFATDATAAERMFQNELVLYVSVPLGLLSGLLVGLVSGWTHQATIVFSFQLVLLLASLVLLSFLVIAFSRMTDPMFRTAKVPSAKLVEEKKGGLLGPIRKMLKLVVPTASSDEEDREQKDLDLACMLADLRKIYLYDAVHNVVLLVGCIAFAVSLWGIVVDLKWFIGCLILLSLALNQLPYVIGQSRLHEQVLERYEGIKREQIAEKLKKYAPLFPKSDFVTALFATGTAGGLVYFLLDQFVKSALK